jgi:hypothetical protein
MGNFLDNVNKSREEWLKKPNPVRRARFLNTNLNTSLVINQEPILEPNQNPDPKSVLEPISETEIEQK